MNRHAFITLLGLAMPLAGCPSQPKTLQPLAKLPSQKMEKFDIEAFRKHAPNGVWEYVDKDSVRVQVTETKLNFIERRMPAQGWLATYREYYKTGVLELEGNQFINGDYRAGVWMFYTEQGKLEKSEDYDKHFKLTWAQVLDILQKNKIPFGRLFPHNRVDRGPLDGRQVWMVQYMANPALMERLYLDDATGKIIKREPIPMDN